MNRKNKKKKIMEDIIKFPTFLSFQKATSFDYQKWAEERKILLDTMYLKSIRKSSSIAKSLKKCVTRF